MDYDVLILGGGIIGCSIAYELSKYSLNIALIEKEYDIADDISIINTSTIFDGIECEDTLMAKLEVMGNSMFDEITDKFNVPFKRYGSYLIAKDDAQGKVLDMIYERSVKRGIKGLTIIEGKNIPNFNVDIKKALYSENTGVVCPYDLAIAYGEVAYDNGVNFKLEEEVLDIQKISRGFRVITNKNKFTCKTVINTTPGKNFSIDTQVNNTEESVQNNLNYLLLNKHFDGNCKDIIFDMGEDNEFISIQPTLKGGNLISINLNRNTDFQEIRKIASSLIKGIEGKNIVDYYKLPYYKGPIIIDDSLIDKGYIKISGKHYGEITMTPAIASMVCETIVNNLNSKLKKDFVDKRREVYRFRELSNEERNKLIKEDKSYGKIICLCQQVTEGEIIDAIRRPLGARTVEGIRRRTGVTFGSCQGAYCLDRIVSILARETTRSETEIVKNSKNSKIIASRIKEFNEM